MDSDSDDGLGNALHLLRLAAEAAQKLSGQKKWEEANDHLQKAIATGVTQLLIEVDDMRVAAAEKRLVDAHHQIATTLMLRAILEEVKAGAGDRAASEGP